MMFMVSENGPTLARGCESVTRWDGSLSLSNLSPIITNFANIILSNINYEQMYQLNQYT